MGKSLLSGLSSALNGPQFESKRMGQGEVQEFLRDRTKWVVVVSEFAPICIYLVISLLVSLISLNVPFPFSSNSSTCPKKLLAYECGLDLSSDAKNRFDIQFYLVSILFIILDTEVTFSFPWAVPLNKIDLFGSWSMMAFLFILTIGFLYEWKKGTSDWE
ncbi:NADH-ubiquinone oxidoreductase chain 3-like [Benincasa hispida]|uniref:NADH-ubiquinone oxidoreductase chain 3-like n=1 Tax=Benincasa hispida TaxID=102211 RepID=UPI00190108E6|nr:NADH-ubiquinone oxidoreductase chain 3-like [Benincasa hispida]